MDGTSGRSRSCRGSARRGRGRRGGVCSFGRHGCGPPRLPPRSGTVVIADSVAAYQRRVGAGARPLGSRARMRPRSPSPSVGSRETRARKERRPAGRARDHGRAAGDSWCIRTRPADRRAPWIRWARLSDDLVGSLDEAGRDGRDHFENDPSRSIVGARRPGAGAQRRSWDLPARRRWTATDMGRSGRNRLLRAGTGCEGHRPDHGKPTETASS